MVDDYKDLWAPPSIEVQSENKEKDKVLLNDEAKVFLKKKSKVFLKEKVIEGETTPPPFGDSKAILADIGDVEKRREALESLIARYEIYLVDLDLKNGAYKNKHRELFESGKIDDEVMRVNDAIAQICREMKYFQTRLKHNDLDFSAFKKKSDLKKLYAPFGTKDAALYSGLSVNTINKNPEEYGADMSSKPYKYPSETLDEILRNKDKVSPYWEYPELVIQAPISVMKTVADTSAPSKILWRGKSSSSQLRKLIDLWVNDGYIDCSSFDIGEYISDRFTTEEDDHRPGKHIHWLGGLKDLIAYIDNLEDRGLLFIKGIGPSNYLNLFLKEHFKRIGKDSTIQPFKPDSLSATRSQVKKIYANAGKATDSFTKRAIKILDEIDEIVKLEKL